MPTIRDLRGERQLTQAEFAERLGVSSRAVRQWETGRWMPRVPMLKAIAYEFGVRMEDIELLTEPMRGLRAGRPRRPARATAADTPGT